MTRLLWVAVVPFCLLLGCPARPRPTGPPPEYEVPRVMPWDAAAPVDPLDNLEGEAVTDDPPEPESTADAAPQDAESVDAGAGDAAQDGA